MKHKHFPRRLGAILLALWSALYIWQNPGITGRRLTAPEIEQYMHNIASVPYNDAEKVELFKRLRAWMAADDGKPVYMLNLMRFYDQIQPFPGAPAGFKGTPQESNAIYEKAASAYLLRVGGYPMFMGSHSGKNIVEYAADKDDWSRTLLVRYPSRRAVMEHFSYPAFQAVEPYKLMALRVILAPTVAEVALPDLSLLAGAAFLIIFLAAGWHRAARRAA